MLSDFLKKHIFYRQHPDTALRYLPIVSLIRNKNWQNKKILEVGSGSYGITPYLNKKVVGVDLSFDEPEYGLLKQVEGSATEIPFERNSFEVVIICDVLEHLAKRNRKKALDESVRVASQSVIIMGPFGKQAGEQDQQLAKLSLKQTNQMHHFFEDHLKFGLPEVIDVFNYLRENPKVAKVEVIGSYLNLGVRKFIMSFFISRFKLGYFFYLKGLMVLIPIFRMCNFKPNYRTLILVGLR